MVGRCVRLSSRNIEALMTSLTLPVMLMLLFVYLFGGAIDTGTKYVTYVVPGVILLCAGWSSSTTSVTVTQDMQGGLIDRFRSMDIGGVSVLTGHVVASIARNAASTLLVLGVALLIGFRPTAGPLEWLGAAGIVLAYVLAITWLAATVGLLAKSTESASSFTFFVAFLPYASSAFVPIDTMPGWIQGFARHQPITPVTETIRGLLLGSPVGNNPWWALGWCAGIVAVSVALSTVLFQRRVR
jgi:ABC-2 type transport system permease protein